MKRKLVEQGKTTLMISLPAKWIKQFGLKKGDEIELDEEGSKIVISAKRGTERNKKEINSSGIESMLLYFIGTYYIYGVDELKITYSDPKIPEKAQEIIDNLLLGYEIVEQGKDYVIIKNVAEQIVENFDNVLKRSLLIFIDIFEEGLNAVKKCKFEKLKELHSSNQTARKLLELCQRILLKKYENPKKVPVMYLALWTLRTNTFLYDRLIEELISNKCKLSFPLIKAYQQINAKLEDFYHLFYNYNHQAEIEFEERLVELLKKLETQLKEIPHREALIMFYLIEILQGIRRVSHTVLALAC